MIEGDPIDVALSWATSNEKEGEIPVISMANDKKPGGDWESSSWLSSNRWNWVLISSQMSWPPRKTCVDEAISLRHGTMHEGIIQVITRFRPKEGFILNTLVRNSSLLSIPNSVSGIPSFGCCDRQQLFFKLESLSHIEIFLSTFERLNLSLLHKFSLSLCFSCEIWWGSTVVFRCGPENYKLWKDFKGMH